MRLHLIIKSNAIFMLNYPKRSQNPFFQGKMRKNVALCMADCEQGEIITHACNYISFYISYHPSQVRRKHSEMGAATFTSSHVHSCDKLVGVVE